MNIALILAGGIGTRMGAAIPKQFIEVNNKPIIVYTLENFQKNNNIDRIIIVSHKEWINKVESLVKKYKISKTLEIIEGGSCGHDSIRNGVFGLEKIASNDDFILIHDAVRPILPQKAIDEVLTIAYKYGNASSSIICHPPIVYIEDANYGSKDVERDKVMLTSSPQVYKYDELFELYERAEKENKHYFTFTSSMYIHYGKRIYFAKGTSCNIKITTKADLCLFKALLTIPEDELFD